MATLTTQQKIQALRTELANQDLDAIIVPTADPHLSEYLPAYWQAREWLSGFTGSAGTLVVTADHAYLWADSRYWVQAEAELAGTGIELQKLQRNAPNHVQWLAKNLPAGASVAVDGNVLSVAEQEQLLDSFEDSFEDGISDNIQENAQDDAQDDAQEKEILLITDRDVIGNIWTDRPALPQAKLFRHKAEFVDTTAKQKLAQVREQLASMQATHHLLSSLDDIAWLTNLRGADVDYNPVFLSHVLISQHTATLFIEQSKLSDELATELTQAGFDIADYEAVQTALASLTEADSLAIDPHKVAVGTLAQLPDDIAIIEQIAPSTLLKSCKSTADIAHIQEAMRQDGVALCQFFAEFERRLSAGDRLSELDVDSMLIDYRSQQPHYVSPSFPTIAGFNANGALPHYRATADSFSYFGGADDPAGLLLIDSGAQYHNGTTDITRVVPIVSDFNKVDEEISPQQKRDFTLVLKAHIALAQAQFPQGIGAPLLDTICRAPLWAEQLDYGHGTGHGVGYFLNVHEGPQSIAYQAPNTPARAMKTGMITSNEPGLYREGKWGIRIENLVANVAVEQPKEADSANDFGDYLRFETVTLCPIDTRLVDKSLLSEQETNWLNDYHSRVRHELENRVEGNALAWLIERTQRI